MICKRDGIGEGGNGMGRGWGEGFSGEFPKLFRLGGVGGSKNNTCTSSFPSLFGRRGVGGSKEKYSHIFPFTRVSGKVGWGVKPSHFPLVIFPIGPLACISRCWAYWYSETNGHSLRPNLGFPNLRFCRRRRADAETSAHPRKT